MPAIGSYFRMVKVAFKWTGMSLEKSDSVYYRIYSISFIVLIVIAYPLMQLSDLFKHNFDVTTDGDVVYYEICCMAELAQVFIVYPNRRRIGKLLTKIQQEPLSVNPKRGGETEEGLMKECALIVTVQTLSYWIAVGASVFTATSFAIMKRTNREDPREWDLPFGPLTVLNITHSPNYEITLAYQSFSILYMAFQYSVVDSFLPGILCYMVYQFKILNHNIKLMTSERGRDMFQDENLITEIHNQVQNPSKALPWKDLKISVKETIEYHLAITEAVNEIEEIFNTLLLLKFLDTMGLLCFIVYIISMIPLDDPKMIPMASQAIVAYFHVFLVCFWGEKLNHESEQIGTAAFGTDFVGTDIKFQKAMILIIRRSQSALGVSAGKFSPVCLPTFAWVVRTSWSVFLVLRNLNAKDL